LGAFWWIIRSRKYPILESWKLSGAQIGSYIGEFYSYSHPLFMHALIGFLIAIIDRWMLQVFGGSAQQGFFGLSYTICAFCFIFTSAMQPLLMREFSISYGNKNLVQMKVLFRKYIPLLYSIAAYFSCFIAVQSPNIINMIGGKSYQAAIIPVAIMAFYPLHQTYGQLSGSVFFATDQTPLYRNIGVIFGLIGLPLTYLLIAPMNMYGFGAGAVGLAIKTVALTVFAVNVQLYFNAKYLKFSFIKYLGHQIFSVICLLIVAIIPSLIIELALRNSLNLVIRFILAGMIYTGLVALLVFHFPVIFGMTRADLDSIKDVAVKKIRGKIQ